MTIDELLQNWNDEVIQHLRADNARQMPTLRKDAEDLVKCGFTPDELTVIERQGTCHVVPLIAVRKK